MTGNSANLSIDNLFMTIIIKETILKLKKCHVKIVKVLLPMYTNNFFIWQSLRLINAETLNTISNPATAENRNGITCL